MESVLGIGIGKGGGSGAENSGATTHVFPWEKKIPGSTGAIPRLCSSLSVSRAGNLEFQDFALPMK